jgi:hypothetical protein
VILRVSTTPPLVTEWSTPLYGACWIWESCPMIMQPFLGWGCSLTRRLSNHSTASWATTLVRSL